MIALRFNRDRSRIPKIRGCTNDLAAMHPATTSVSSPEPGTADRPLRYRLVVFDLDGTLADSFPFFVACQKRLAARHGFRPIVDHEVATLRGWTPRQLMRHTGLPAWKLPRVAKDFRRMMEADVGAVACFPGIHEALRRLHGTGVQLALVSSNSSVNCRRVLGPASWSLLSHAECGAALFGKARCLRRLLRRAGVTPGEAIHVGDQATDAQAARAVGMAFGAVSWGYASVESLCALAPERLLRDVTDLATLGSHRSADIPGNGVGCS